MTRQNLDSDLISLASRQYPDVDFAQLWRSLYSERLSAEKRDQFRWFIEFARRQQEQNPVYEPVFQQLLSLYVLNGSRLDALSRLDRRIAGLGAGQASLVLITGRSGIGKTSLVLALGHRIDQIGAQLVIARCSEQECTPYAMWRDISRDVAVATGGSLAELPQPIGNGRAATSAHDLLRALASWLNSVTTSRPLVVLLDDLHWADVDSLNILNDLTSRDRKPAIVFIGTYRSEESNLGHPFYDYWPRLQRNRLFEQIYLQPFTGQDIERFVSAYLGASSPQLAAYLFEQAEGHPLFTRELLNSLIEKDLLVKDEEGQWLPPATSVAVPTLLVQIITQRVHRLGAGVGRLLPIAAVAGETWSLNIIEEPTGLAEADLLAALEEALAADLIVADDAQTETYRFTHGLIRQVLYNQQLARRRKQLHEQIARQFEQQEGANSYALAHHYFAAGNWQKAAAYGLQAGELAVKNFANNRTLDLLQQTLDAAQHGGKAIEPALLLEIYERLGHAYQVLDRLQEAEVTYSRMRDAAQNLCSLKGEVKALTQMTRVRIAQYQLNIAEQTAYEALKIGEQVDDPRLMAQIQNSLIKLHIIQGNFDAFDLYAQQILKQAAIVDPVTLSDALRQVAYQAIFRGRYPEAEEFARRSLAQAQKSGVPLHIAGGYQILSFIQIELGQYDQAFNNMRSILDYAEMSVQYHHQLSRLLNQMGYLYLELGDAAGALVWDQRAVVASRESPGTSNFEMQRYSLLNLATDYLHLGKIEKAEEAVAQFEAIKKAPDYAQYRYDNRYLLVLAELQLAHKNFAEAVEFTREARNYARSYGALKNISKSYWVEGRALLGMRKYHDAQQMLEEAVRLADGIGHGSLPWKMRLDLAQVQIDAGRSASETLQKAQEMMERTADSLWGSPLHESFISSPWMAKIAALEQAPAPEKTSYPAGLTGREVEVLRLVAGGATNQQVADRLHISVRTVDTHITNILNKTDCDNRTAASAFAAQNNLLAT